MMLCIIIVSERVMPLNGLTSKRTYQKNCIVIIFKKTLTTIKLSKYATTYRAYLWHYATIILLTGLLLLSCSKAVVWIVVDVPPHCNWVEDNKILILVIGVPPLIGILNPKCLVERLFESLGRVGILWNNSDSWIPLDVLPDCFPMPMKVLVRFWGMLLMFHDLWGDSSPNSKLQTPNSCLKLFFCFFYLFFFFGTLIIATDFNMSKMHSCMRLPSVSQSHWLSPRVINWLD